MALKVDYIKVSVTDAANRYVNLSNPPTDGTVALDVIGGTAQAQVSDFYMDSTKVKWDSPSYNLYNQVDSSTELRAIYNK